MKYKIFSPVNFPEDPHVKKGQILEFNKLPDWAKGNGKIIVEQIDEEEKELDQPVPDLVTARNPNPDEKGTSICPICGKKCKNAWGLKLHRRKMGH
jgi:hypothetical protein